MATYIMQWLYSMSAAELGRNLRGRDKASFIVKKIWVYYFRNNSFKYCPDGKRGRPAMVAVAGNGAVQQRGQELVMTVGQQRRHEGFCNYCWGQTYLSFCDKLHVRPSQTAHWLQSKPEAPLCTMQALNSGPAWMSCLMCYKVRLSNLIRLYSLSLEVTDVEVDTDGEYCEG